MDSLNCTFYGNQTEEFDACLQMLDNFIQKRLDAPMPWVGMYIAAASALCLLAITVDAINGFLSEKIWFPCKYFSLNAFSLTVLAVTMKLPIDLTSNTRGAKDKLAVVSSLVLMSTAMANFMTSLGSMENNEITLNVAALGILVITIAVNVCIHIVQMDKYLDIFLSEEAKSIIPMLLLLVTICSLAVMVSCAKRYIESKYNGMHRSVSNKQVEWEKFTVDELRIMVKRYWVMAATSNPQFVMARSAISGTSGLMCLLVAVILAQALVQNYYRDPPSLGIPTNYFMITSNYKWSIDWILFIQLGGVTLGTIAPLHRWFLAARFKASEIGQKSLRDEFMIESYWTSRLVEWRESALPIHIRHRICKKLLHDAKRSVLSICIGVQILFVLTSKLVLLISATFGSAILWCFHHIKNLIRPHSRASVDTTGLESRAGRELDFSRYVLLLEGEAKLPEKILKNFCNEVDKLMQIGEKKQPKNLIELLKKSVNFSGVREFDSKEVPSLHSQEPPNCWSLPVVTLTSIAVALSNITIDNANQLLRRVSEGLSVLKLIEKTLDRNGEVESIRNAADVVWVGVELYKKWQGKDLQSPSVRGGTHKETLQKLSDIAKKTVEDFMSKKEVLNDILMENPLNWPVKVIAANSMYRVTQTILLAHKDDEHLTDEKLFERLSIMISDIMAACLTNLVHVITFKCHSNTILERQKSVRQAAILLGESEQILGILQQLEIPRLDHEKAANIDVWRSFMEQASQNPPASSSASSDNAANPQPNGDHVSIEVEG